MALWGDKELKGATGTISINASGTVTGTNTKFNTEVKVGNYIICNGATGVHYLVTYIDGSTGISATVTSDNLPGATQVNASFNVTEKPAYIDASETKANPAAVFGVDATEQVVAGATGPAHAGWVRRIVGTGGRAGRVQYETLVASGSINPSYDAENTVFPNS